MTVAGLVTGLALDAMPAADRDVPVKVAARVDLDRRLPNRFQKDCSGNVTAEYSARDDGRIEVVNRCATSGRGELKAEGVATIVDETTRAKLEVRFAPAFLSFLPMVWGDSWIIDLASDYGYAVVGDPSRTYLWILAREPILDEPTYRAILERIEVQGYDPADLVHTPQDNP